MICPIHAKIELNGGFIGEATVMVLETVDLTDPGADIRAYAPASTIDVKTSTSGKTIRISRARFITVLITGYT